jgi:hypothetical protein
MQTIVRREERCSECGAVNPFRLMRGWRRAGAARVAPAKCRKCGAPVHVKYCPDSGQPPLDSSPVPPLR